MKPKNPEKEREYQRRYRESHPGRLTEYMREYRRNPENKKKAQRYSVDNKEVIYMNHLARRAEPHIRMRRLVMTARNRAKKRGYGFDDGAVAKFIETPPTHCDCCGVKLAYTFGRGQNMTKNSDSPSIDKVDNSLGYIIGNVAVICYRCNILKRNGTEEEFVRILEYMRKHKKLRLVVDNSAEQDKETANGKA